jgi:predicted CXXCH cytochrome family protein
MRAHLTHIIHGPTAAPARRVELLDVEALTLGRGTDNDVCLPGLSVSLHHARIVTRGESLWVEAVDAPRVLVNRRPRASARLKPRDVMRIGRTELRVLPPDAPADLVLEIEETERLGDERAELAKRTKMGIERGLLTRRTLSWTGFVLLLAVFLAFPLLSENQGSWNSGPVSNKHGFIGDQCERCHGVFEAVNDDACLTCHFETAPHTADDREVAGLSDTRCASCHIEHTGSTMLTDLGEPLCAGCHASITDSLATAVVGDASDFGDDHPDFRLHVVTAAGSGERLRAVWSADLEERSGLHFSHLRHVGQKLPLPDGSKANVDCATCHRLGEAGATMQPIDFETSCRDCHRLTFDETIPEREAVHGDLDRMREELRELYSDQVVQGDIRDKRSPRSLRFRRPGKRLTPAEQLAAREWVGKKVDQATRHLMVNPGECARCHEIVSGPAEGDGLGVAPVEVASAWMPKSEFRHATHAPFHCRDCHPAAAVYDPEDAAQLPRPAWSLPESKPYGLLTPAELESEYGLQPSVRSSDVLLPSIDRCRGCHGGQDADPPQVASGCGLCHPFHRREHDAVDSASLQAPVRVQSERKRVHGLGG